MRLENRDDFTIRIFLFRSFDCYFDFCRMVRVVINDYLVCNLLFGKSPFHALERFKLCLNHFGFDTFVMA
ncbi:hypothetical protein AYJ66_17360 [Dietzia cinnamea]|nr:hypothetical protein AYJ66_17360 [Dietzia cinnamea]